MTTICKRLATNIIKACVVISLTSVSSIAMATYEKGMTEYANKNYKAAMAEFMPLAKQGNQAAQTDVANMYQNGEGTPKNIKEAIYWYTKAAEQGNVMAQLFLGLIYTEDATLNKKEAAKWLKLAAENGSAVAQTTLGMMYESGFGVKQDNVEAIKWLKKAADQGDEAAKKELKTLTLNKKTK